VIVTDSETYNLRDFYNIYNVLKDGGMIRIGNKVVLFELKNGYASIKVAVIGEEIDEKVMFNKMTAYKPKKAVVKKVVKKPTVIQGIETESKVTDLW